MKKPAHLRETLAAALAHKLELATDPDRLIMTATNWSPAADMRPGSGLQIGYTLELTFLDFVGDPIEITIPIMLWLARYQHDALAASDGRKAVEGTFELLQHDKFDAHIRLQLTERVRYQPRENGPGFDVVYLDEPEPMAFEDGPPLHELFLNGEQLFHCTAHPDA
ncbi:MAG: phage tail protein [Brevundimonas sp.]|uniref:phage tail protein n=1 Tax=Brevundimonas sp. TaxID=1871086 RepID=UPI00391BC7AD